ALPFVCPGELTCCADQGERSVTVSWSGGEDLPGFRLLRDGELAGTLSGDATSFTDTGLSAGPHVYELHLDGGASCANLPLRCDVVIRRPDDQFFFDDFDCYTDDRELDMRGWRRIDAGGAIESSTWTVTNPLGRRNPPGSDGRPSSGGFLISDSDFGGRPQGDNSNTPGTGMSHDVVSPPFDTSGSDVVWLHLDVAAQLNDNGDAVFDIDVSTDGGTSWVNAFRRVSPGRTLEPLPSLDLDNADGLYGRLDVDLSSVAARRAAVRVRLRHFEPTWEWFIAVDNFLVDSRPAGGSQDVLDTQGFDGAGAGELPAGWDAESGPGSDASAPWSVVDTCPRSIAPDGIFIDGRGLHHFDEAFAIVDPACFASQADELLRMPPVDLSGFARAFLHVRSVLFRAGGDTAEVLVSLDGGETFEAEPVFSYGLGALAVNGEDPHFGELVLEAPAAAGRKDVVFAFHYTSNGAAGGWWAIDDVAVTAEGGAGSRFVRGDADANGSINLTDGIVILNFLFLGADAPRCLDAADTDDDGGERPTLTDAVIIFAWLFSGGAPPRDPGPDAPNYSAGRCGLDETDDGMDCAAVAAPCNP
ncbi:MAG: hypothetical protein O7J95_08995, partial [Planctomycetota bacterium]|nr:hypothetical protein [Planctomycetota bacterium]